MKKRVLVVDDSILMRQILKDIINKSSKFTVAGEAADGFEAIDKFKQLNPDIVTLDIEMPKMNGLMTLQQLMRINPVPVIMISAYSREGTKISLTALEYGAFDIVEKPSGSVSIDLHVKENEIIEKLEAAVQVNMGNLISKSEERSVGKKHPQKEGRVAGTLVAVAASTGGPKALMEIIPKLRYGIKGAIAIVQHMPPGFTKSFSERLDSLSSMSVFEAQDGDILHNGDCAVAPGGYHMIFDDKGIVRLNQDAPYHSVRPSADIMMLSAVRYFGKNIIGIVLTGMGKDGSEGAQLIKMTGGTVIAESKESAVIFGMPRAAIDTGKVDHILSKHEIPSRVEEILDEMERTETGD